MTWALTGNLTQRRKGRKGVHRLLGPGLLESVYLATLVYELQERGLRVESEQPIAISHESFYLEVSFRADVIVEDKVIVELESVEQLSPVHKKQLLTYLRLSNMRLGLLINFGAAVIKDGISCVVNGLIE